MKSFARSGNVFRLGRSSCVALTSGQPRIVSDTGCPSFFATSSMMAMFEIVSAPTPRFSEFTECQRSPTRIILPSGASIVPGPSVHRTAGDGSELPIDQRWNQIAHGLRGPDPVVGLVRGVRPIPELGRVVALFVRPRGRVVVERDRTARF